MPTPTEDPWINEQVLTNDISILEDNAIAVDASYYLQLFFDNPPYSEPLLPALGGLTGIQTHIENDLDCWEQHKVTPFFIFNGQSLVGEDDVTVQRGKRAIAGTDNAWALYFASQASEAVAAFGTSKGLITSRRRLHFLVPPCNASAQIAYFDMIESEQCGLIMGSQELLLYPIKDYLVRYIDWDANQVQFMMKSRIIRSLGVTESMFVDAFLMAGSTFLPAFPPLKDSNITPRQPSSVQDAVNMLRTSEKSVSHACNSFNDILGKRGDPNWLKKYRKAKMCVDHFIYIAESGAIEVHNHDTLTGDNYLYLGYQLPAELFHYLNTGLISARLPTWISHGQILVYPTLDGVVSEEYKKLVTTQLMSIREMAIALVYPRLSRGIQHQPITVKVWYDDKYSHQIQYRPADNQAVVQRAHTWNVKAGDVEKFFPEAEHGSILFEVTSLRNKDFAKLTIATGKIKGIESEKLVKSITLWRFLHLRGYVDQNHHLTSWGEALTKSLEALHPTAAKNPSVPGLFEAVLLAYELLRHDLLNTRNQNPELGGLPMLGNEGDKQSLILISRCAILLKLRHQANGYTGPLSKNFLCYRSLCSSVRESGRDLIEAIVVSLLLNAQTDRDKDFFNIGHGLPFLADTDIALGIAVKTFFDDILLGETDAARKARRTEFPIKYVPYATNFYEDLDIACDFFGALHAGVKTLTNEVSAADRGAWDRAAEYLKPRR